MTAEQESKEIAAQYERDKLERKRMAEYHLANDKLKFHREPKSGPLVMGKPKKALDTTLDLEERAQLRQLVSEQCKLYKKIVNERFHDNYDKSIMMDEDDTRIKNEILRKTQYEKMKKAKLPNFIRLQREKILRQRQIDERNKVMN